MEDKTLKEEFKELKEIMISDVAKKQKKEIQPRLPFRARVGKNKASKGYVGIWKINENGFINMLTGSGIIAMSKNGSMMKLNRLK